MTTTGRDLTIGELAARTGVSPGAIRMWERRYGFPDPPRTQSGYRRYCEDDVEVLLRVRADRERGLSMPAALERARATTGPTDRPSLFAAIASDEESLRPYGLTKAALGKLAHAIEDEALARAARPVVFAAFQRETFYRAVEHRYRRLARGADATVVLADFPRQAARANGLAEVPIGDDEAIANEWAVVVDAPGYSACLVAWEQPTRLAPGGPDDQRRRFESAWTTDPRVTRRAATLAARLVGDKDGKLGRRLERLLADRPLALEQPAPALTALTNRIVEYVAGD